MDITSFPDIMGNGGAGHFHYGGVWCYVRFAAAFRGSGAATTVPALRGVY
jgi:hypothetical protein